MLSAADQNFKKKSYAFLLICIGLMLLHYLADSFGIFAEFENKTWDLRLRLIADASRADQKIKLIVIDQQSLDYFAEEQSLTWPWPRPLYIPLIKFLEKGGAKGVAFDILFTESSVQGVEDDRQFAESLDANMPVVSAAALGMSHSLNADSFALFEKIQQASRAENYLAGSKVLEHQSATFPIPEVLQHTHALGMVNAAPDSDGVFRHYRVGARLKSVSVLSLPFALYETLSLPNTPKLAPFLDQEGRLALRFHGPSGTYHSESVARIIQSYVALENGQKPIVDPSSFKDALVFIGVWAPGLLDLRPIPLDEVYRGVEYNATVLDNLIHQDFMRKVPLRYALLFALFFVAAAAAVTLFMASLSMQLLALLLLYLLYLASAVFLAANGWWIPMALGLVAFSAAIMLGFAFHYQLEGRQHRFVRQAFGHYVSSAVIEKIVRDPSALSLGGDRRELSIFFSDLQGFTSISESLEASQLVKLLNLYLTAMTNQVMQSGGTLDKYQGDAVIAFWNAPLNVPDHALRAVNTALSCQKKLAEMHDQLQAEFGVSLKMRIGLHSGLVSVGNFGSQDRFDYTVIGDAANLASRLEGVNKQFGTSILLSEATYQALEQKVLCRKVGNIQVVGKKQIITVYQPLEAGSVWQDRAKLDLYHQALAAFEAGNLEVARVIFEKFNQDSLSKIYLERIEKELKLNRSQDWSAVWRLESK